jgi:hypothetical protein
MSAPRRFRPSCHKAIDEAARRARLEAAHEHARDAGEAGASAVAEFVDDLIADGADTRLIAADLESLISWARTLCDAVRS